MTMTRDEIRDRAVQKIKDERDIWKSLAQISQRNWKEEAANWRLKYEAMKLLALHLLSEQAKRSEEVGE